MARLDDLEIGMDVLTPDGWAGKVCFFADADWVGVRDKDGDDDSFRAGDLVIL